MNSSDLIKKKAPAFKLHNQNDELRTNRDYIGQWLVLYFYPKDNTPGCSTEAMEFTQLKKQFFQKGAVIVGVSPDSVASHQKFIEKKDLDIELLSDEKKTAASAFGVWQLKKMAGKEYMGVVRTTFLIDPQGTIQQVWQKVRVKGHVDAVMAELCDFTQ
ncbi:MAG: peroxiredoxin [Deltaproteobacteria bacterium]|nr:peroxiredoxin [Deltaproteobacteria bacterium]